MRDENGKCRHRVDRDRFRHRGGERPSKKGNSAPSLAICWREFILELRIRAGAKKRWILQPGLALIGGDITVEKLSDVVDGQEVVAIHGNDYSVPDL